MAPFLTVKWHADRGRCGKALARSSVRTTTLCGRSRRPAGRKASNRRCGKRVSLTIVAMLASRGDECDASWQRRRESSADGRHAQCDDVRNLSLAVPNARRLCVGGLAYGPQGALSHIWAQGRAHLETEKQTDIVGANANLIHFGVELVHAQISPLEPVGYLAPFPPDQPGR